MDGIRQEKQYDLLFYSYPSIFVVYAEEGWVCAKDG